MGDILQPTHLLFVLVVALLVLGPKRLPEVGRALGRGLRDFRSAMSGEDRSEPAIPPTSDPTPVPAAFDEPSEPPAFHEPTEPPAFDEPIEPEGSPLPSHAATTTHNGGSESPTATPNGGLEVPTTEHNDGTPSTDMGPSTETAPEPSASEPVTSVTGSDSSS